MGREIKRVPLDFEWPIGKVWQGYLSPERYHFPKCLDCNGSGYSPEAAAINETFYPHQIGGPNADRLAWGDKIGQAEVDHLVAEGRLSLVVKRLGRTPTAAEVNAMNGRGRSVFLDGHDAINRWILVKFRCDQLGIVELCPACQGHGDVATDEQRAEAYAWEREEPPTSDGWQLWETASEGSPISPVLATPEALAEWMSSPAYTWGAARPLQYEQALKWITGPGWAPSLMSSGCAVYDGVAAMSGVAATPSGRVD